MGTDFEVTMDEYLPLRDVVFNTLRQSHTAGGTETRREADGDSACK